MACKTLQGKYAERLEMNNKELNKAIMKAEHEYEMLKDNIHDLYEENKKLKEEKEMWQKLADRLYNEIDKAIKYIKGHTDKLKTTRVPKIDFNYNEVLEILGDKE